MKKTVLLLIAFIGSITYSIAQDINVGVRLGVTSAKFKGVDDELDFDEVVKRLNSVSFAVPIEIKISDKFSFQPELAFVSRGFRAVIDERKSLDYFASVSYKINYFELPLLAKGNFEQDKIRFSVYAGPSIGFALNGKIKYYENDEGDIDRDSETFDLKDSDINRIEIGLNLGGMASYEVGPGRAFVDLRLQTGLTKVSDDIRSNLFGLSFGYLIPLKL